MLYYVMYTVKQLLTIIISSCFYGGHTFHYSYIIIHYLLLNQPSLSMLLLLTNALLLQLILDCALNHLKNLYIVLKKSKIEGLEVKRHL